MGRRGNRVNNHVHEIFVIGEQLRCQMHGNSQIKDRRYHLRKYRKCFIGRDCVDWLLKLYHVQSREEAVSAMMTLQNNGIIHHVVDEHGFKDQHLFYRFTRDDDTFKLNRELSSFYRGFEIYQRLKSSSEKVLRDVYHKGNLYSEAFYGCEILDFVMLSENIPLAGRDGVLKEFRDLLERDVIKHVTDDYHFSDDKLIYEFSIDFNKPCLLQDVLGMTSRDTEGSIETSSGIVEMEKLHRNKTTTSGTSRVSGSPRQSFDSSCFSQTSESDNISIASQSAEPKSVLVRPASLQELEDPTSPYVKKHISMSSDDIGFGFVLRGSSPCYVQAVDPLGPAAASGLKVRMFVSSVNGNDVLRMSHREVGQIMAAKNFLSLTVLTTRRDRQT